VWFDIDNTLYSASTQISQAMGKKIHGLSFHRVPSCPIQLSPDYFVNLGLGEDEASELHLQYYKTYGLALAGLIRHHDVGNAACLPPSA
jgi:pyrimidine and pyridine-specific 5'-nucleotidase